MMNRRGPHPNDPDITGPRGGVADCQERLARIAQARLERIIRLVRPTDEQRGAFEELRMASAKALEVLRGACPIERPLTPTARMAAAEKWLEARLQAIRLVRPALNSFYRQLTDDRKIRWSMDAGDRFGTERREQYDPRRGIAADRAGTDVATSGGGGGSAARRRAARRALARRTGSLWRRARPRRRRSLRRTAARR